MAGNRAQVQNYLNNALGVTEERVRDAITDQGLDSFEAFDLLSDEDIKSVCSNARKPGGSVVNPAFHATDNPTAPPTIANTGATISLSLERRLRQLGHLATYLKFTQRTITATNLDPGVAQKLWEHKIRIKDDDDDVKFPAKLTNVDKVREVIENIQDYLDRKRGVQSAPLSYVIREEVAAGPELGTGIPTFDDDMIARTRHDGDNYKIDNASVWDCIRHVTHEGPGYSWVSPHSRAKDGRAAFRALFGHYMGESYTHALKAKADKVIDTAFYDGKSRNFTFETYTKRLNEAFTDLESAEDPLTQDRKVRILLKGIRDPQLDAATKAVVATPHLKASFESARNYIAQFKLEDESMQSKNSRNVSSVTRNGGQGRGGRGRGGRGRGGRGRGRGNGGRGRGSATLTDRYYSPEEWRNLSSEEQQRVRTLRRERSNDSRSVAATQSDKRQRTDDGSTAPDSITVQAANPPLGPQMNRRE